MLELFWTFLTREVERRGQTARFERARRIARRLPYRLRRLLFRRSVHAQFGGELHLFVSAGAYLPPELQQAWEDLGIIVIQGYGSTECGIVTANDQWRHPAGVVGRVREPSIVKLHPETSEILVRGPNVSAGYWRNDEATAASLDPDGWFLTGDAGRFGEQRASPARIGQAALGQDAERKRLQGVAGQERHGFAKRGMAGRLAAAQRVVVHAGKVVVINDLRLIIRAMKAAGIVEIQTISERYNQAKKTATERREFAQSRAALREEAMKVKVREVLNEDGI